MSSSVGGLHCGLLFNCSPGPLQPPTCRPSVSFFPELPFWHDGRVVTGRRNSILSRGGPSISKCNRVRPVDWLQRLLQERVGVILPLRPWNTFHAARAVSALAESAFHPIYLVR